ncbi:hypothetical protein GWK47_015748 [Chionoecetes opilio]|uniref:Uncharacterized protein n=1 Tax=Chionoecetes opilio TaxID=41210 RepID=A0A8J4Y2S6_CHIOP|nr:hypothetical protein GWK47_015748 [Chionoecetes opilio]
MSRPIKPHKLERAKNEGRSLPPEARCRRPQMFRQDQLHILPPKKGLLRVKKPWGQMTMLGQWPEICWFRFVPGLKVSVTSLHWRPIICLLGWAAGKSPSLSGKGKPKGVINAKPEQKHFSERSLQEMSGKRDLLFSFFPYGSFSKSLADFGSGVNNKIRFLKAT